MNHIHGTHPCTAPCSPLLPAIFIACTASAADFANEMLEATFKLFHPDSTATCFFVRRAQPDTALYLVTAAHALEKTKGETAIVVLRQRKTDGTVERHDHKITIRCNDKPLWTKHEKHDVAVLRLAESLPIAVAALPASAIATTARLTAADVHICRPALCANLSAAIRGERGPATPWLGKAFLPARRCCRWIPIPRSWPISPPLPATAADRWFMGRGRRPSVAGGHRAGPGPPR